MANQPIYICDSCGSFSDVKDIWKVQVSNFRNMYTTAVHPNLSSSISKEREICTSCLDKMIDDLKLNSTPENITKELFKDFKVPRFVDDLDD